MLTLPVASGVRHPFATNTLVPRNRTRTNMTHGSGPICVQFPRWIKPTDQKIDNGVASFFSRTSSPHQGIHFFQQHVPVPRTKSCRSASHDHDHDFERRRPTRHLVLQRNDRRQQGQLSTKEEPWSKKRIVKINQNINRCQKKRQVQQKIH
jgi:hypothetical protein